MIISIAENRPTPFDIEDFNFVGDPENGKIVLTFHPEDFPDDHEDILDSIQQAEIMLDQHLQRPTQFVGMDLKQNGQVEMRFVVRGSVEDWRYYVG